MRYAPDVPIAGVHCARSQAEDAVMHERVARLVADRAIRYKLKEDSTRVPTDYPWLRRNPGAGAACGRPASRCGATTGHRFHRNACPRTHHVRRPARTGCGWRHERPGRTQRAGLFWPKPPERGACEVPLTEARAQDNPLIRCVTRVPRRRKISRRGRCGNLRLTAIH